jgi:hypothetical protein
MTDRRESRDSYYLPCYGAFSAFCGKKIHFRLPSSLPSLLVLERRVWREDRGRKEKGGRRKKEKGGRRKEERNKEGREKQGMTKFRRRYGFHGRPSWDPQWRLPRASLFGNTSSCSCTYLHILNSKLINLRKKKICAKKISF